MRMDRAKEREKDLESTMKTLEEEEEEKSMKLKEKKGWMLRRN